MVRWCSFLLVGLAGICGCEAEGGSGEDTLDACSDDVDNDRDGLVDCEDPACGAFPRCETRDGGADAGSDAGPDAGQSDAEVPTLFDPELADPETLELWGDWFQVPRLDDRRMQESSTIDRGDGEPPPLPLLGNGNKDLNNFVCKSADASPLDDEPIVPHRFDLEACPEPWVTGWVLARAEGFGGYVSRVWLTTLAMQNGGGGSEILRIYRDDDRTPAVQARIRDLVDGAVLPFFARPRSAYQPVSLVLRHPIVFDHRVVVTIDRLSWVTTYWAQVDAQRTGASRPRYDGLPRDDLRETALSLEPGGGEAVGGADLDVPAGGEVEADARSGAGTLHRIEITTEPEALGELWLVARWDGRAEPAIDAPLASLFGAALGPTPHAAPFAPTSEVEGLWVAELRLPMPYRAGVSIALRSTAKVDRLAAVFFDVDDSPPPDDHGYLHVVRSVTTAPAAGPHTLVDLEGRGSYAGAWLYLEGHATDPEVSEDPLVFLEGDLDGWVDGERALRGTGTEDYLDSAFYFADGAFAALDAGVVLLEPGRVAGYRMHLLTDALQFGRSLRLELEVGTADPRMLDRYETVAFVYLDEP
ncbi:MAG: DUF2961 domain-containing protein [Deltaproteobacteria bacterium]|nr:DUF2961 domain-containing protein [Deltaproteobacteria bacterium]